LDMVRVSFSFMDLQIRQGMHALMV
jgi:hypothetical protein